MGMETLNNAARAAGFAMAASDEPYEQVKAEGKPVPAWRPSEALVLPAASLQAPHRSAEWLRSMLGFFGRRAPASPA